jgi:hypothetical protein
MSEFERSMAIFDSLRVIETFLETMRGRESATGFAAASEVLMPIVQGALADAIVLCDVFRAPVPGKRLKLVKA